MAAKEREKQALIEQMNEARMAREKEAMLETEQARQARLQQMQKDFDAHLSVRRIKKGDSEHFPRIGDMVGITYSGTFADGVEHQSQEYGGQMFDTTLKKDPKMEKKVHRPLLFRLGDGKAIRGLEETLKTMSLGERVIVTIDSNVRPAL